MKIKELQNGNLFTLPSEEDKYLHLFVGRTAGTGLAEIYTLAKWWTLEEFKEFGGFPATEARWVFDELSPHRFDPELECRKMVICPEEDVVPIPIIVQ